MMLAKSLPINPPDAAIPVDRFLSITTDLAVEWRPRSPRAAQA
jgi:hypothetical protein